MPIIDTWDYGGRPFCICLFGRVIDGASHLTTIMTDKDRSLEQPLLNVDDSSGAGPSGLPPPSFEESGGDAVVVFEDVDDTFHEEGEEPPEFMPYEAEHWISSAGEIISLDHHLNEDGA
jgi:hypothetical protein